MPTRCDVATCMSYPRRRSRFCIEHMPESTRLRLVRERRKVGIKGDLPDYLKPRRSLADGAPHADR